MTQKEKLILTWGLILSAYAYAYAGYAEIAAVLGFAAACTALKAHSLNCLKRHMGAVLAETAAAAALYRALDPEGILPVLPFLGMTNIIAAEIFAESSFKAYDGFVPLMMYVMLGMLTCALVIPDSIMDFFLYGEGGRFEACMMILLIFLPLMKVYTCKVLSRYRRTKPIALGRDLR
ncbi:MAG: hypothetical protein IJJ29_00915 [Solobacterium sp.]|nr:hypothetical protein [Solobacterium sp.]